MNLSLLFVVAVAGLEEPAPVVAFEDRGSELVIRVDGKPLGRWVMKHPEVKRPHFQDLHAPSGRMVTRPCPPRPNLDPADHPTMHPGLWLAFGDVDGHDFWRNRAEVVHAGFEEPPTAFPGGGRFTVRHRYLAGSKPICEETCRIIIRCTEKSTTIDWSSTFRSESAVRFGDQEEMGLGIRVATSMTVARGGSIRNSEGDRDERGVWGKPADWCSYQEGEGPQLLGVALFSDPSNFRRPWFHARDYGLLVANPFGRHSFGKGSPSAVVLGPGSPLKLNYRIVIHDGELPADAGSFPKPAPGTPR
ncbi:MAG: PmoA family protein [Isosphaeraceae bacterium]|nr:PmoA family protein [Isosphaeraceae bacterium]